MSAVMVNNWENGTPVGGFDTVGEAEAYTLENGLDVTIFNYTTLNGTGYRFNADINARREATGTLDPIVDGQHRTEYEVDQTLLGYPDDSSDPEDGWK